MKVKVVDIGRESLVHRWYDQNGTLRQRSARTSNRAKAERLAGKLEAELNEGRFKEPHQISWDEFRHLCEDEKLAAMPKKSIQAYSSALNHVERHLRPNKLSEMNSQAISRLATSIRKTGVANATIAKVLRHVKACLSWAHQLGLLVEMPEFPKIREMPEFPKIRTVKSSTAMKGRPISQQEYEKMLEVIPSVVGTERNSQWKYYLEGMWLSGLRLAESMEVYWDRRDKLYIDLSGRFPMLRINGAYEKGRQDRVLPIVPDFAEFLLNTPESDRHGPVFRLHGKHNPEHRLPAEHVGKLFCKIGKAADVLVDSRGKGKYASAHDFRRSFGERWAPQVMPDVLKELMRHRDIKVTLDYYVGVNAERTAERLWLEYK